MIRATLSPTGMRISGHAGSAPYGQDIVCAAVSALVQTFKAGVEEFTKDDVETLVDAQSGQIRGFIWSERHTSELGVLIRTLWKGLSLIEASYPEYIETEM